MEKLRSILKLPKLLRENKIEEADELLLRYSKTLERIQKGDVLLSKEAVDQFVMHCEAVVEESIKKYKKSPYGVAFFPGLSAAIAYAQYSEMLNAAKVGDYKKVVEGYKRFLKYLDKEKVTEVFKSIDPRFQRFSFDNLTKEKTQSELVQTLKEMGYKGMSAFYEVFLEILEKELGGKDSGRGTKSSLVLYTVAIGILIGALSFAAITAINASLDASKYIGTTSLIHFAYLLFFLVPTFTLITLFTSLSED